MTTQDPPRTLEHLLVMAATNPELRRALLEDQDLLQQHGYSLSEAERAVLQVTSRSQLEEMLDHMATVHAVVRDVPRRREAITTGIRVDDLQEICTGSRPEDPTPTAPHGLRPGQVKGSRPGRVLLVAAAASSVLVAGGLLLTAGSRPDPAPVVAPPSAEQRPDAGPDGRPDAEGNKKTGS